MDVFDQWNHNARASVTHGKLLEGTRLLNVGKGGLEILKLGVDFLRGLLRLRDLSFAQWYISIPPRRTLLRCLHVINMKP